MAAIDTFRGAMQSGVEEPGPDLMHHVYQKYFCKAPRGPTTAPGAAVTVTPTVVPVTTDAPTVVPHSTVTASVVPLTTVSPMSLAGYQGHLVNYQEGALTNPAAYQPWVCPGPLSTPRRPFLVPPSSTPGPSPNLSTLDLSQFATSSFFEMMGSAGQSPARPPSVSSAPPTEPLSDTLETARKTQEKHHEPLLPLK